VKIYGGRRLTHGWGQTDFCFGVRMVRWIYFFCFDFVSWPSGVLLWRFSCIISPWPENEPRSIAEYLEAEGEAPRREDDPTSRDSKLAAMDEDDPASLLWLYLRPSCARGGGGAKD